MSLPTPTLPSATGAFQISDGARTVTLPSTVNSDLEGRSATSYNNRPDGVSGTIFRRSAAFDAISIELKGLILDSTIIQDLSRIIASGRVTLTRGGRTLQGDIVDWVLWENVTGQIWDFSLSVESNWYYWQGSTINSSADPASVTNSGDFSLYPTLSFLGDTGGATVVSVTINGRTATYTGTINGGEELVLDCDRLTARVDGSNVLGGMNASFFTEPPILLPGANTVTISNTGAAILTVSHTERFLS